MNNETYSKLVDESHDYLDNRIARAQETFGIWQYERFDCDLPAGRIWWSDAGIPKVEARLIVVGSLSTESNTWLWGWANSNLKGVAMEDIERVRNFGEENGLEQLTERKWPADGADGWEMTAIAARLLEAESAYRTPSRTGFLYLLLTDFRRLPQEPA